VFARVALNVCHRDGRFALWLDDELRRGHSSSSLTYRNDPLASSADFECLAVELWGLSDDVRAPEVRWRRPGQPSMAALAARAATDLHRPAGAPVVGPDSTASPLIAPSSLALAAPSATPWPRESSPLAAKNR
jgi:hypothetical protein